MIDSSRYELQVESKRKYFLTFYQSTKAGKIEGNDITTSFEQKCKSFQLGVNYPQQLNEVVN